MDELDIEETRPVLTVGVVKANDYTKEYMLPHTIRYKSSFSFGYSFAEE